MDNLLEVGVKSGRSRAIARILKSPGQGDRVEYWWVQADLDPPRISHFRLTYHEHTAWKDRVGHGGHQNDSRGRDYDQEWSVQEEQPEGWQSNGRSDTDWLWRRLRDPWVFIEEGLAKDRFRGLLQERLICQQQEMATTQALLNEL